MQLLIASVLLACSFHLGSASKPACRTDDGKAVDWYLVYKFPQLVKRGGFFESGDAYAYITSGIANKIASGQAQTGWRISEKAFTDPKSMVMRTLAEGLSSSPSVHRLFYNNLPAEQSGQTPSLTRAHAKGFMVFDEDENDSILVSHSVPQFPASAEIENALTDKERARGHTFLCVSFDLESSASQIVEYLGQLKPQFTLQDLSPALYEKLAGIEQVSQARYKPQSERTKVCINSKVGKQFCLYAKSARPREDIYSKWLNYELQSDLNFLGYRSGFKGSMPNACYEDYKVNNARRLKVKLSQKEVAETISWSSVQQEGKLAWTKGEDRKVVCVGDADRRSDQLSRAVGAICFEEPSVWSALESSVSEFVEGCGIKDLPVDK